MADAASRPHCPHRLVPTDGDPLVHDDPGAWRIEALRLRDAMAGSEARIEVLEDRIRELEEAQEIYDGMAEANARLRSDYERLAGNPVVRVLLALSRPFRRPGRDQATPPA